MMKNPFKKRAGVRETLDLTKLLFIAQMKPMYKNLAAGLVCLGLLVLPPLYAWFNIASNWSPYDKTSNLKVAVTSLDKGTEIEGVSINIGDEIVKALKANDKIGWQFVSYEEGQKAVESGDYYAALVIPKNFSAQITGFLHGNTKQGQIEYYINEKQNAISTKIMGTGMDTVASEIDKTFIETVTDIVLNTLKVADSEFAEYKPSLLKMVDTMDLASENMTLLVDNMNDFEKMLDQMDALADDAQSVLPKASEALRDASDLTLEAQNSLQETKSTVGDIERLLGQSVNGLGVFASDLEGLGRSLRGLGDEDEEVVKSKLEESIDSVNALRDHTGTLADNLNRFNAMLPESSKVLTDFVEKLDALDANLESACNQLMDLRDELESSKEGADAIASKAAAVLSETAGDTTDALNSYNSRVSASLKSSANQMNKTLDATYKVLQDVSGLVPVMDSTLGTVRSMEPVGKDTIEHLKTIIENTQKKLDEQTKSLKELSEDEKVDKMVAFIQQDAQKQSEFLSSPVKLHTNRMYPVENYGSGMSPFYTTLAIWVGCLLMMAMISPINEKGEEAYPEAGVTPMYLSRLLLYQIVSVFQCLIIALGDLFILKVDCMHPVLFVLLCILIGQIFSIFIFSLVFTFSAIGKAMAIVVLVLQIAASGGTFPMEMTPPLFQMIHPLLPFTYCIGAMREICFGIYEPALVLDLSVMAMIPILSVAVVVIFGPVFRKFVHLFETSMKNSGLM